MDEDNLTRQVDEIEAMSAIYGDDWCVVDEVSRIYCIAVTAENKSNSKVCIQVLLPDEYPSQEPPVHQLNAPWLTGNNRIHLEKDLSDVCAENIGDSVLYLMVEKVKEFLEEHGPCEDTKAVEKLSEEVAALSPFEKDEQPSSDNLSSPVREYHQTNDTFIQMQLSQSIELPPIIHGNPITDRRSTFQPHVAFPIVEVQQVRLLLNKLCENKKIANATHNIMAYRIYKEDRDSFIQDCDDDGETAAGGRLLHLLQIVDARNVMVVVSRWYGGILLGPDRFKHINNAARSILESSGFIHHKEDSHKAKKTKQKKR